MVKSPFRTSFGVAAVAAVFAAATAAAVMAPARADDDVAGKAQVCAACHGENGTPIDPKTMPIIWGQQSNYLYKELHDFHSGDRQSPIMAPTVKDLSLQDLRAMANYFAAKTWPAAPAAGTSGGAANAPATTPVAAAAPPEGIGMCKACHGQNFEGGAPAPRLAGLSYEYLAAQMRNFADGARSNNLDMPGFMRTLSEGQRDAIARYLSAL
jgi:cytochrome c553